MFFAFIVALVIALALIISGAPPTSFVATGALALIALSVIQARTAAELVVPSTSVKPNTSPGRSTVESNIAASTSIVLRPMIDEDHGAPGSGGNMRVMSAMQSVIGMTMRVIHAARTWTMAAVRGNTGRTALAT